MENLKELIDKLCPNGVEYKKIKDVYKRLKGTPITAGKMREIENDYGDIKIFAGGKTIINAFEKDIPKANITTIPAVLVQSRGIIDFIFYDKPFTFKNEMWAYTAENIISVKFLYYVLKNNIEYFRKAASGMGSMPQISLTITEDFFVPVPPLEVQQEIVHILDNFSFLSAELSAELKARKKQYEYYKDKTFLTLENERKENFGNICEKVTKQTGFDYTNNIKNSLIVEYREQHLPYIQTKFFTGTKFEYDTDYYIPENIANQYPKILLDKKCILLSIVGASIGNIGLFPGIRKCFLGGAICVAKVKDEYNIEYIYHYLTSRFGQKQIFNKVKGAGQATVTIEDIRNFKIPVPVIEKQNEIACKLNKLDKICNDISEGLPAEIEARQKQYEYYRDKLLTFKELVNEG